MKEINIEEMFCPKAYELQGNVEDGLFAEIIDAELDTFTVNFNYDGCAEIQTGGMTHIALYPDDLRKLANLIGKAERKYKKEL